MAIADRKFKGGERLVSTGKKYAGRTVDVVKTKDGLIYRLDDGQEFKSPSAAGAAVFGKGRTCNGWAFWSIAVRHSEPTTLGTKLPPDDGWRAVLVAVPKVVQYPKGGWL
jgi:hypothetical protein